jgi:acyl carrier protein
MDVTEQIKTILVEDVFVEVPPEDMRDDDDLREVFGLDSVGFVELRARCEDVFGVTVSNDDFTPDNFATLGSVSDLVRRLLATIPAP